MKKLRIFYIENIYKGLANNRKNKILQDMIFSDHQKQEDFPPETDPEEAIQSIKDRYGKPPQERIKEVDNFTDPYVDGFWHSVVDLNEVVDKYQPAREKMFEESLFPPVMLADCKSVKPGSKKK